MTSEVMLWFIGILLTTTGASVGFGMSQMTMIAKVREHEVKLDALKENFIQESHRTDERILRVAKLVESSNELVKKALEQNMELVTLIKIQRNNDA